MAWQQITNAISQFFDKPITISLSLVLSIAYFVFLFFSKTSLGKKAIKKLTNLYNLGEQRAKETLEKVKEVELLAKNEIASLKADYEQKANDLKANYDQKSAALASIFNYYVESLFTTLEKIPNIKVQEEVKALREGYEVKKEEIINLVGAIYQDYDAFKQKTELAIRNEYETKIKFLEDKYKELALYLSELKEGRIDGQGEESVNS